MAFSFKDNALSYSTPTGVAEEAIDVLPFQQHLVAGRWWACVSCKSAVPVTTEGKRLGVDLGTKNIAKYK